MTHVTASESSHACFAVAAPGLAPLVEQELRQLACRSRLELEGGETGGVAFRADTAGLYAANLHLRIATRVLVRLGAFHAAAFGELERHARRLPWARFVAPGTRLTFRVTSKKSRLYHQEAVAQRLATAAAESVATHSSADAPPQEIVVRLYRDQCTVSADASGELLHRRGYRLALAKAPLRETLASAMLAAIGWDGTVPLIDPMCGSGTIPIEAALLARRIPAGLGRDFAVQRWPAFEEREWRRVMEEARAGILPTAATRIVGSDRDAGAVASAAANAERAGVGRDIEWRRAAISAIATPPGSGWIVTNPPYGVRVGDRQKLRDLYAQLGNVARRRCPGWGVAFLASHSELERQTGLDPTPVFATENGGIRVRLVQARVRDEGGTG